MGQWGTILFYVSAAEPIDREVLMDKLRPAIGGAYSSTQYPATSFFTPTIVPDIEDGYTVGYKYSGGPFNGLMAGETDYFVTAFKWNIKARVGEFTTTKASNLRALIRSNVYPELRAMGIRIIQMSVQPYGRSMAGDRGVPVTPALPATTGPIVDDPIPGGGGGLNWGAALAALLGAVALARQ